MKDLSKFKAFLTRAARSMVSRLDALYQSEADRECYIFGDGVSLKWMDLTVFRDRPAITGNMIPYHKESAALNMPYCVLSEPYWFWPIFPYRDEQGFRFLRHRVHEEYRRMVRTRLSTTFLINISNYPVTRFTNAIYISRWYAPPFKERNPFSERADAHHGTLRFQLSLAVFLGFKKAYLVGHDYTHCPARSLHFYEKGIGVPNENRGFCREYINYAQQYIDLTTITLNSGSDTMKAIDYKEFTGREPRFRENTELVPMDKLQSLAKWHDYKVF